MELAFRVECSHHNSCTPIDLVVLETLLGFPKNVFERLFGVCGEDLSKSARQILGALARAYLSFLVTTNAVGHWNHALVITNHKRILTAFVPLVKFGIIENGSIEERELGCTRRVSKCSSLVHIVELPESNWGGNWGRGFGAKLCKHFYKVIKL